MQEIISEGTSSWPPGSHSPMTQQYQDDYSNGLTVRHLFVFLKENIIFDIFENELTEMNVFTDDISKEYINKVPGNSYRIEKLLKLFIKTKKCKDFIECMRKSSSHRHVFDRIQEYQKYEATNALKIVEKGEGPKFSVNRQLLQDHFQVLYYELEPREIADEMLTTGHFSPNDHDSVTDLKNRNKRLHSLLNILERKQLYAPFLVLLETLGHTVVLETLKTESHFDHKPCDDALCIQHSFTTLRKELPEIDHSTLMVESVLDDSDISDITGCDHVIRQKSKLIKIILKKGENACNTLLRAIHEQLKRDDLIRKMISKNDYIQRRGRPELSPNLRSLTTTCLTEHEPFLYDELEPLYITDLLFEEKAVTILAHDEITETICRENQTKNLLKTLMANNRDCLHFFLYIIQEKKQFQYICKRLENPANVYLDDSTVQSTWSSIEHELVREPGCVENEPIQVKLTIPGRMEIEQDLVQCISFRNADILETAISCGQMDISEATKGSVVLQLRPVTDDAVQTLLNAIENNRLLDMILEMVKKVDKAKVMDYERPLQIRVQVVYAKSPVTETNTGSLNATLIKKRVKINEETLFEELEPAVIVSALSKTNVYPKTALDRVCEPRSCFKQFQRLLAMVEEGSPESVEGFVTVLRDLGYSEIVKLITAPDLENKPDLIEFPEDHGEAEKIRKLITMNYRNILDEMQTPLARETLSKCNGNVNEIKEVLCDGCKSRRERMNIFLRFILHDDHNVVEFAKVLRKNGLKELLSSKGRRQRENMSDQGIVLTFVGESFLVSPDEVLFDSIITLSRGDDKTDAWTEIINFQNLSDFFHSFNIDLLEDPSQKSFTRNILEAFNFDKLVGEIRSLARSVVLCKHIKDEDKIPGTVYVYEVIVTSRKNQIYIKEMNLQEEIDFFHRKNDDLIKIILIKGGPANVTETKRKVRQKYEKFISFQNIYLHHESEKCAEIAKLIAHKKVKTYKQSVMTVKDSIPINDIGHIVRHAVLRALSKERITELCFEAIIEESGNIESGPYYCHSSSTVKRLKKELMEKALQSVSDYLGSNICEEMQRYIVIDIKSKFDFGLDPFTKFLGISKLILIESILTGLFAHCIDLYVAVIVGAATVVGTFIVAINVNSRSWRKNVASEIFEKVYKNRDEVVKEVTSNVMELCEITNFQLDRIAIQLDTFTSRLSGPSFEMETDTDWTLPVTSPDLKRLLESFQLNLPEDPRQAPFAKHLMSAIACYTIVDNINLLSQRAILHREFHNRAENAKQGSTHVFEVEVVCTKGNFVVIEKDAFQRSAFFHPASRNMVKIIWIYSKSLNVVDAKLTVFRNYEQYLKNETIFLQHEFDNTENVIRFSAYQQVKSIGENIHAIAQGISNNVIGIILQAATNRVLSKESITQLCYGIVLRDNGINIGTGACASYSCRSILTVMRLQEQLVDLTLKETATQIRSEICHGILNYIDFKMKIKLEQICLLYKVEILEKLVPTFNDAAADVVVTMNTPLIGNIMDVSTLIQTFVWSVDVNSMDWRRKVADEIFDIINKHKTEILKKIESEVQLLCWQALQELKAVSNAIADFQRNIGYIEQKSLICEWKKREAFMYDNNLKKLPSVLTYLAGTRNGTPVVKVFLTGDDNKDAAIYIHEHYPAVLFEFVNVNMESKKILEDMEKIEKCEQFAPEIGKETRTQMNACIKRHAKKIFANHSSIIGIEISSVRSFCNTLLYESCIVLFCLDECILPYGESPLPKTLEGYPCDIRKEFLMLGHRGGRKTVNIGCSIGIPSVNLVGSVGFFVRSTDSTDSSRSGFLTAAHVAIENYDELYENSSLLSKHSLARESHKIIHLSHADNSLNNIIGEVIESFFGNYGPNGTGMDAAFVQTNQEILGEKMYLLDDNSLVFNGSMLVKKKGSATGDTIGKLVGDCMCIRVYSTEVHGRYYEFENCFTVKGMDRPFFENGDSGSGVCLFDEKDNSLKPLGIAFAFFRSKTVVCKIGTITNAFNVSVHGDNEMTDT